LAVSENLLVVEDDPEWYDLYTRAAAREGVRTVRIAKDLTEAKSLINDMQFAVAFVDIGLNVGDDQNVDGMRVMEAIRENGDQTSIVVVTGRHRTDNIPITRDAIKKYDAYEVVRKADIEPQDIRRLLRSGLQAFREKLSEAHRGPYDVLRGSLNLIAWDDQVLRATGARGGVQGLHGFVDKLLGGFIPMVAERDSCATGAGLGTGIVHGRYWSRSIAKPIAVCFGDAQQAAPKIAAARSTGSLLGRYEVGVLLREHSDSNLGGAVFALKDVSREDFVNA